MAGLTPVSVVNMALANLGSRPLTALTDDTDIGVACNRMYTIERDAMLSEHPWNFAMVRTTLYPYREPATTLTPGATTGTGVTFTAGAVGTFFIAGDSDVGRTLEATAIAGEATIATNPKTNPAQTLTPAAGALVEGTTGVVFTAGGSVFVAGDIGKVITNDTGDGIATITAQGGTTATATINEAFPSVSALASGSWSLSSTSTVTADITTTFASVAAIASGDWLVRNVVPTWDYAQSIALPTNLLRMWRIDERERFQREGQYLITDAGSINVLYISQVTDPDLWSPHFLQAFIHRLTWKLAMPVSGRSELAKLHFELYQATLRTAKTSDGQEGTPEPLISDELTRVRYGTGRDTTRTGWWRGRWD